MTGVSGVEEYASADDLLVGGPPEDDIVLPSGRRVRVRGLTRFELLLSGKGTDDTAEIERRNVQVCMVEPKLTAAQVAKWQKSSTPDELGAVTAAIRRLSGLGEGAGKSRVAEVRD